MTGPLRDEWERERVRGGRENRRVRKWERELKRLWVECLREMARRCAYITLTLDSSWRLKLIPKGNDVCLCVGHLVFPFQLWRRAAGYLVRKEQWVCALEWELKWALCSPFTWPISRLLLDMLRLREAGCDRDSIMSSERRDQRRTEHERRSGRVPARKCAILYS